MYLIQLTIVVVLVFALVCWIIKTEKEVSK